ncbi:hypothetical protein [Rhodopirellula sp. MGV]|uniref:hypothetical protein n=1 Tax=Rhodopirellula sp. MGV TaxID=2023130 RepID=UPI000B96C9C0|nr:hypothetical protein [Rhodopirellula sp. MGV]OYP36441.1 hypothetical protein CGZ80_09060 [Rhodopirellula sp. MGV]PNY36868.1 hypothetical protein C2E31_10970 [Rhodopirellula baltica]
MNIIDACRDPNLFKPFLEDSSGSVATWKRWFACLRALHGIKLGESSKKTLREVASRDASGLPTNGFDTALFLTGRRSGKSRIAAVLGAYEAALAGNEKRLAKGERGVVAIIAPTKNQGTIVRNYLRSVFDVPMLAGELVGETKEGFDLKNGIQIRIMAGDFRTVRGFTLVAAIVDEIAFFGLEEESKVKSDTELIRAIQPSLATCQGKLIAISSPYAKRGWTYRTFKRHFGTDSSNVLVVNCPSRSLNPTLSQSIVDAAMAEDPSSARSEYYGEFREDISAFISRDAVEAVVINGRQQLLPCPDFKYFAFVDMSGGRSDDHALAIAHYRNRIVTLDFIRRYKAGLCPYEVAKEMCEELRQYGIREVTGDNYAADWVAQAFRDSNIRFKKADRNKSALYLELLPRLGSLQIELLDYPVLVEQLVGLERRTRSGGKDVIDHPSGGHDDVANVVAGVSCSASAGRRIVTALRNPNSFSFYA